MTVYYPVLFRRIVLTSENNSIRLVEGGVSETVTVTAGTYALDAISEPDDGDLLSAVVTALDSHSGGNTYSATVTYSTDPTAEQATITISRATGASTFSLAFDNAANTFDETLLGFPAGVATSTGTSAASTISPTSIWVGDQPFASIEPTYEREAVVTRAVSGAVRGVDFGGPYESRTLSMQFISERRAIGDWTEQLSTSNDASMARFIHRCAGNGRFWVYPVTISSGFTLSDPTSGTNAIGAPSSAPWIFDEATQQSFSARRVEPGLSLYDFDLRLLRHP